MVKLEEKEDNDAAWEGSLFWCSSSHLPLFTAMESSIGFSFTFSFTRHCKKIKKRMREEILTVYPLLWRTVHGLPSSLPSVNTCGGKFIVPIEFSLFIWLILHKALGHHKCEQKAPKIADIQSNYFSSLAILKDSPFEGSHSWYLRLPAMASMSRKSTGCTSSWTKLK